MHTGIPFQNHTILEPDTYAFTESPNLSDFRKPQKGKSVFKQRGQTGRF